MPFVGVGSLFGSLEPSQQDEVLRNVAEESAIRFKLYLDVIRSGGNLRDLTGEDALNFYRARSPEDWTRLEQLDPQKHREQLRQWAALQASAETRLNKMIEEVAPSSIKSLARSRYTEKEATAKIKQSNIGPQF